MNITSMGVYVFNKFKCMDVLPGKFIKSFSYERRRSWFDVQAVTCLDGEGRDRARTLLFDEDGLFKQEKDQLIIPQNEKEHLGYGNPSPALSSITRPPPILPEVPSAVRPNQYFNLPLSILNAKGVSVFIVVLVIGSLLGGGVGWFVYSPKIKGYKEDVSSLSTDLALAIEQIEVLEDEKENLASQVGVLQQSIAENLQSIEQLEVALDDALAELEKNHWKEQYVQLNITYSEVYQHFSEIVDTISELEIEVSMKNALIDGLEENIVSLEDRIIELEDQLEKLGDSGLTDFIFVETSFSRLDDTSARLRYWIGRANDTIKIMMYLITQNELANAIKAAHDRGVDVTIVIDDDWVSASGSDYQSLKDYGVDIRNDERTSGKMHHKVVIIDGYLVVVGSYNWSASAEDSNDESVLIIKSTAIASEYLDEFDRIWSQTALPPPQQYTLTIGISGSGSTNPSPGSHTYDEDTDVQVTAIPASGWDFDYWKLDDINVGSQNPYSVSMNAYHTLVAVFVEEPQSPPISQYELTISISGSGTTNPSQGSHTYDESTNVQVTAIPASGWDFDHWLLDGVNVGGANPYSVAMNEDHILSAIFQEEPPLVGQVVINEVEANPPGNDNYGDVLEWVELYNPSSVVVDISGWKVSTTHGTTVTLIIPGGTTLSPGGYYIVQRGQQWIDNEDEKLVLKDSANNVKDTSRTINDTDNDNNSWQRNPDGASNWSYKTSTKGSAN